MSRVVGEAGAEAEGGEEVSCPECERLRAEVKKWRDAAIDACAKIGSLRALCREAADTISLMSWGRELANRLRKAGGET